jgi:hypothetical protein
MSSVSGTPDDFRIFTEDECPSLIVARVPRGVLVASAPKSDGHGTLHESETKSSFLEIATAGCDG